MVFRVMEIRVVVFCVMVFLVEIFRGMVFRDMVFIASDCIELYSVLWYSMLRYRRPRSGGSGGRRSKQSCKSETRPWVRRGGSVHIYSCFVGMHIHLFLTSAN